jgi:predicted DNA-binding transcriptional regulator AlpA
MPASIGKAGALTLAEAAALPPTLSLTEAALLLGIGRTSAYQMAAAGTFPVPVLRLGRSIRVPTAPLLHLLGLSVPGPESGPDDGEPSDASTDDRARSRPGWDPGWAHRGASSRRSNEPVDVTRDVERAWEPRPR